jgi:hypothetical protein
VILLNVSKIIEWFLPLPLFLFGPRKTLESTGSEIGIPSDTHQTRSEFSLMTKFLATDDPSTYAQAKDKPEWEKSMTCRV